MSLSRRKQIPNKLSTSVGLSLIELMVTLAISSLLIVGAVTVYMQSRNTYRTTETAARLQEVARYAMDVVAPDVRLAGLWGLTNQTEGVTNAAEPAEAQQAVDATVGSNCGNNWIVDVTRYIDGRDATATGGTGYNLACAGTNAVAWSDVLIIRRASSEPVALDAGQMQIQSNRISATIFSDGTLPSAYIAAGSETHDLIVRAYYVSEILPSPNGIRQFALRRQTLVEGAGGPTIRDEEVIPGIQDLQVQFGIDTNSDGTTDRYVNPGNVPAGARISTAQIWLLAVAEEREIGFSDGTDYTYANANHTAAVFHGDRRRVLVTKTIQIRNAPT